MSISKFFCLSSQKPLLFFKISFFYVSFHADLSYTFSAIILLSHIIIFITAKNENERLFFISYWTGALLTRFYTILCMVGPLIVRIFQPIFLIISIFVPSYLFLPSIPFLPDSFSLFDGLLLPLSVVYVMVISLIYIIAYFIKYLYLKRKQQHCQFIVGGSLYWPGKIVFQQLLLTTVVSLLFIAAYLIKYFRLRNHTLPKLG